MATTRSQVNTLAARATRTMLNSYKDDALLLRRFIRSAMFEAKKVGTQEAKTTFLAMMRELYIDIYGEEPVGKRHFFKWIQQACHSTPPRLGEIVDPISGIDKDDADHAIPEDIT